VGTAVAAALIAIVVALGLAFAHRGDPAPVVLSSNSVGFIDARSGRVTKSFPVGREPRALTVSDNSLWVANYRERTVTRLDRAGRPSVMPVGGHPVSLTAHEGKVWVWTIEGRLLPIDPRFNSAGKPLPLGRQIAALTSPTGGVIGANRRGEDGGRIASGGGFLWMTVPLETVIRLSPTDLQHAALISPDGGARAPIVPRRGEVWVAGYDEVFPIDARTGDPGSGIRVGHARDLAFGAGSLWAVAGVDVNQIIDPALRRVDLNGGVVEAEIEVGDDPVAVAWAGGSIWVGSRSDRVVKRVDPTKNAVVETIPLGAPPRALVTDRDGVWVAVE
jgi:DNA-binding beta-propeller fold protein YncE